MESTTTNKKKPNEWHSFMRAMGIMLIIGSALFGLAWLAIVKDHRETVWPLPRQHPPLFLANFLMIMAWIFLSFALLALVGGSITAIIKKEST